MKDSAAVERPRSLLWDWRVASGAAVLLVVGAVLPPFVGEPLRTLVHQAFAPVCHQMAERSFAVGGVPFAVCHRCFGIYAGVLGGTVLWAILAPRLRDGMGKHAGPFVVVAGLPALINWAGGVLGWWVNTSLSQTGTGAVLGVAMGLLLARALADGGAQGRAAATGVGSCE